MILVILALLFGGVIGFLVAGIKYHVLLIHASNVAVILYLAHLVDTYNDLKKREEYQHGYRPRFLIDGHNPDKVIYLNVKHYLLGIYTIIPVAVLLSGILVFEVGLGYGLFALAGLALALTYGFGLDRIFILGDVAWACGTILAFLGGFYVVTGAVTPEILIMSLILLPILLGAKILDAEPDIEVDRKSVPMKKTIPVKLGLKWSHRVAYILFIAPIVLLGFLVPNLHPSLIYPLIVAAGLIIYSYRLPAIKGIYPIMIGIAFFLIWAITVLIVSR